MVLAQICTPALIYLVFSITQVSIDTVQGAYNTALVKIWVALVFTVLLNYLCMSGLGVISWLIVFIPFILMTVIVGMLLFMFGLDPRSGKLNIAYDKNQQRQRPDARARARRRHKFDRFTAEEWAKFKRFKEAQTFNSKYDESKISPQQQKVLSDAALTRAGLYCDPLHDKDCKVPTTTIGQ